MDKSVSMLVPSSTTTTHNLWRLFTLQMVASMISIVMALTLSRLCKRRAMVALDMDMTLDFIMKVILTKKMVVAPTLILPMAFLRLCKEHLLIMILMTALVMVMVLDFLRVHRT